MIRRNLVYWEEEGHDRKPWAHSCCVSLHDHAALQEFRLVIACPVPPWECHKLWGADSAAHAPVLTTRALWAAPGLVVWRGMISALAAHVYNFPCKGFNCCAISRVDGEGLVAYGMGLSQADPASAMTSPVLRTRALLQAD